MIWGMIPGLIQPCTLAKYRELVDFLGTPVILVTLLPTLVVLIATIYTVLRMNYFLIVTIGPVLMMNYFLIVTLRRVLRMKLILIVTQRRRLMMKPVLIVMFVWLRMNLSEWVVRTQYHPKDVTNHDHTCQPLGRGNEFCDIDTA